MNKVIPDNSLIAIKRVNELRDLKDGDIVVFQDGSGISVKKYYNNSEAKIVSFVPDSTDSRFLPIVYLYDDMLDVKIIGKVVLYTVEL